jgi:DTW domain-containing protein YfiP
VKHPEHSNSIMALRARELAKPHRPFLARGSKVVRCQTCLMPLKACICAVRPAPLQGSAFCFILYWGEAFKPTNTGRLVADVIHDNHAFLWDRTRPDPELLALLNNPQYAPILVFPTQYAEPERCIESPAQLPAIAAGRTPLYVMLDGTWREAKKMFRSAYLAPLPVLGLNPEEGSRYQLREAVHKHQLCTAEVAAMVLALGGDAPAAAALGEYFEVFRRNYVASKPHMVLRED